MISHIPLYHNKFTNTDPTVNTFMEIVGSWKGGTDPNGWHLSIYSTGYLMFGWDQGPDLWIIGTTKKIKKNKWTYVMVRIISGVASLYVDGVVDTPTGNVSNIFGRTDWPLTMGWINPIDNLYFKGYQGQIRITKVARPINVPQTIFPENITDDPYWDSVIFLTKPVTGVLTDLKGHTLTPHNGASVSSNNQHFGLDTVSLNGSDQYYDAGIDSVLNTLGTSNITIEAWVYCT